MSAAQRDHDIEKEKKKMHSGIKLTTIGITAALGASFFTPTVASALPTASAPPAVTSISQSRGPIMVKQFWSAILRIFITISRHAAQRMAERGISQATIQRILNEGTVISRHQGVTSIRSGNITVRVNSNTGNVITVIKAGGGGGGGGA